MPLPQGWTDDGNALHNPRNSFVVSGGFRKHVLAAGSWAGGDVPLENEEQGLAHLQEASPDEGAGNRQLFVLHELAWQKATGNIFEVYLGSELQAVRAARDALQATYNQLVMSAKQAADVAAAALATAQAALDACEAAGVIPPAEQKAINDAIVALKELEPFIK